VERFTGLGVGDNAYPLGVVLLSGDLTGQFGLHRAIAGEITGLGVELGEGGQWRGDDDTTTTSGVAVDPPGEQTQGNVGTELVDAARFVLGLETLGQNVDVVTGCIHVLG
jgi:hypothetical protein